MAVDGADLRAWLAPALTMNKVQRPNASDDHQLLRRRQLEHLLAKPELKEFEQRRVRELAAECGATVRFEWYVFADPMAGWVELTEEDLLR